MGRFKMILAMAIFGSIGIFVSYISLPASIIASVRAIIGTAFLGIILGFYKDRSGFSSFKKNAVAIILSGAALGLNWVFLFEAYKYTTIPVATVCYYMAPVFVLILSPLILRERLTVLNIACTLGALAGAILISGVLGTETVHKTGIMYALLAALLYCAVIILNKKINGISSLDTAFYQMAIASVVTVAYTIFTVDMSSVIITEKSAWMLLVLGIVHTGIAYALTFSAAKCMTAQGWGILSYIDPATAIVLAIVVLKQPYGPVEILGTAMIFGFALINGIYKSKRRG
ncbi:MAG: EamA family transporter [Clostridia bacterium]|nr:EamA family transporter [Clostridia bacterium]